MNHFEFRGHRIPKLGYGTWQLTGDDATAAVLNALEAGYRHIDTAQAYENHAAIGAALAESDLPRDELHLTSKIWMDNFEPETLKTSLEQSLERLRTDYLDLLLLHWPNPEVPLTTTLDALCDAQEAGKTRMIGVSNFPTDLLDKAVAESRVPLATNQVEYHPYLSQAPILGRVQRHHMALTAYSPLGRGDVLDDKVLNRIGDRHRKTPGQVALRWLIQQPEVIAIPKAEDPDHARENLDIFDFELSEAEMREIFGLARPDGRLIDPEFAPAWDNAA